MEQIMMLIIWCANVESWHFTVSITQHAGHYDNTTSHQWLQLTGCCIDVIVTIISNTQK